MSYYRDNYFQTYERSERCVCGKICFSKKTAQTKKNFLEKMGKEKNLRIYQCTMSDFWHLTHT